MPGRAGLTRRRSSLVGRPASRWSRRHAVELHRHHQRVAGVQRHLDADLPDRHAELLSLVPKAGQLQPYCPGSFELAQVRVAVAEKGVSK